MPRATRPGPPPAGRGVEGEEEGVVGLCGKGRRCFAEDLLVGDRVAVEGSGQATCPDTLRPLAEVLDKVRRAAGVREEEAVGRKNVYKPDRLFG
jgi:hypothetical protein